MMETEHTFTDGFTEDLIRETLLDPDKGFRYKAPVVCEPLQIKRVLTLQLKLLNLKSTKNTLEHMMEQNHISRQLFPKPAADETIRDEFEKGTIDFTQQVQEKRSKSLLTKVEEGKIRCKLWSCTGNTYQRDALYV